ncbi:MAG: phosphogluconate dehydratase [Thiotrichaceae bacterium]
MIHPNLAAVTQRIHSRSQTTRNAYEATLAQTAQNNGRKQLACGNLAHAVAPLPTHDKFKVIAETAPNLGIITAYNDMLSAHQPFAAYPNLIKQAVRERGATAQVAGGVPAMCDGVTQGQVGMELSLFSRDVIAMAAAIGLSHNTFDAAIFLGVCDKIVPGLVIAAASFGHLPCIFLPAGPMTSGISNDAKTKVRQQYAAGQVGREVLLESEMQSYHDVGTCTFYGTANSNQMLMEFMGLQLPGSSFINPDTPLRHALTIAGAKQAVTLAQQRISAQSILTAESFVNGIIGLHATGGSTNLLLHIVAMARAAGLIITLQDIADLAAITPLLARVYPNGSADVNYFHAAGGLQLVIRELLQAGLLHNEVQTVAGFGLQHYTQEAYLNEQGEAAWREGTSVSYDTTVIRPFNEPFQTTGGLQRLHGNLGEAVIKISAVKPDDQIIQAPARVFHSQEAVKQAFEAGELAQDCIVVVRFQGPSANGMPELHGLSPSLGVLQARGFKVALVTDGRMSGASGKIPAAIHVSPEAAKGGAIACIQDGDLIRLDAVKGELQVLVEDFAQRQPVTLDLTANQSGFGRELFSSLRQSVGNATQGASIFFNQN